MAVLKKYVKVTGTEKSNKCFYITFHIRTSQSQSSVLKLPCSKCNITKYLLKTGLCVILINFSSPVSLAVAYSSVFTK